MKEGEEGARARGQRASRAAAAHVEARHQMARAMAVSWPHARLPPALFQRGAWPSFLLPSCMKYARASGRSRRRYSRAERARARDGEKSAAPGRTSAPCYLMTGAGRRAMPRERRWFVHGGHDGAAISARERWRARCRTLMLPLPWCTPAPRCARQVGVVGPPARALAAGGAARGGSACPPTFRRRRPRRSCCCCSSCT